VETGRVLAGQDAGPCRRADRTGRVAVGEAHPRRRQPVEVRRAKERAAVAAEVLPAHVVDQDDNEVQWLLRCLSPRSETGRTEDARNAKQAQQENTTAAHDRTSFRGSGDGLTGMYPPRRARATGRTVKRRRVSSTIGCRGQASSLPHG